MKTLFLGAKVLFRGELVQKQVLIENGKIAGISDHIDVPQGCRKIRCDGMLLSPGFIDIHVHGGGGFSAMSGKPEDIIAMAEAHARYGTTSILPTTLAAPMHVIIRAVEGIRSAAQMPCNATILGVHLEGPCLSIEQSGAQSKEDLLIPANTDLRPLLDVWKEGVRIMGAAPELPGAMALGDELTRRGILASIAHSNATYYKVQEAVKHGYRDVTHLYSGCSGMIRVKSYRIPGVIEAGLNLDELTVQVIADGKHLPKELLQLICRCKGPDRIELITDGLEYSAAELTEGTVYRQINGVETVYEDGVMKMMDREAFAGSVATMHRCVKTMAGAGIPLAHVLRMASENPARRIGSPNKGRIETGADADIVLMDEKLNIKAVMSGGRMIRDETDPGLSEG